MMYHCYQQGRDTTDKLSVIERHSRARIEYYAKGEMQQLHPDGDYEVIGEIGNYAKQYAEQDVIVTDTGKHIPIFPLGSFKRPFEWVAGYAAVDKDIYVCVIKSVIPQLKGV